MMCIQRTFKNHKILKSGHWNVDVSTWNPQNVCSIQTHLQQNVIPWKYSSVVCKEWLSSGKVRRLPSSISDDTCTADCV